MAAQVSFLILTHLVRLTVLHNIQRPWSCPEFIFKSGPSQTLMCMSCTYNAHVRQYFIIKS